MDMYSKDMIIGILLSSSKPEIQIIKDSNSQIGYRVRLKIILRGRAEYLMAIRRTLLQYDVMASLSTRESDARPRPILRVGGIKNIYKLCDLIPSGIPDRNNDWTTFAEAVNIVANNEHLTLEGLEALFKLKGLI
tara:strand:- start:3751 stop:4155 length:405 start_codon:yes stop_codon:yes gene_type:complete